MKNSKRTHRYHHDYTYHLRISLVEWYALCNICTFSHFLNRISKNVGCHVKFFSFLQFKCQITKAFFLFHQFNQQTSTIKCQTGEWMLGEQRWFWYSFAHNHARKGRICSKKTTNGWVHTMTPPQKNTILNTMLSFLHTIS